MMVQKETEFLKKSRGTGDIKGQNICEIPVPRFPDYASKLSATAVRAIDDLLEKNVKTRIMKFL